MNGINLNTTPPTTTLTYHGDRAPYETSIEVTFYSNEILTRFTLTDIEQLKQQQPNTQTWITVTGFLNTPLIIQLANHYNLHPLVIEDILNMHQRTKIDYFSDYLYLVADLQTSIDISQQLSFILAKNIIISFQEVPSPHFGLVNHRLDLPASRMRTSGADYMLYSLLDALVDTQFHIVNVSEDTIETLEENVIEKSQPLSLPNFYKLKRHVMALRKQLQPLRDVLSLLIKSDETLITNNTSIYLRDVYDHTLRLNESLESQRDMLSTLLEIHLSSINNRMNQTMKVLTMFSAIFIPLSFIASLYGMNFTNMPELHWHYGYYMTLGLMGSVAGGLLIWFRKKGWL